IAVAGVADAAPLDAQGVHALVAGLAGKLAVVARADAAAVVANPALAGAGAEVAFVDLPVAVVVDAVADLGLRRNDRLARRGGATRDTLGDAVGADAMDGRVGDGAGLAAQVAAEAADVEHEVVEVPVVQCAAVAALPGARAGGQVFERDVVRVR